MFAAPLETVYVGLGSNLNNPTQQLDDAIIALRHLPNSQFLQVSAYYQSKALTADGSEQADYLNAVATLTTQLKPLELLAALQAIENTQGRQRSERRWQSRTLDLDILLYGQQLITLPELKIPHPELPNRLFVLQPLYDLAPNLAIPGFGCLADLRQACDNQPLIKLS